MERNIDFKRHLCKFFFLTMCFTPGRQTVQLLDLEEGEVCRKGGSSDSNYVCARVENCKSLENSFMNNTYPDLCSFIGGNPIICCPPIISDIARSPDVDTKVKHKKPVDKKCLQYSKLVGKFPNDSIPGSRAVEISTEVNSTYKTFNLTYVTGGKKAKPQEFPHMAILGYGKTTKENDKWGCGGSLISERWILTAAHCQKNGFSDIAQWARLGDLNTALNTDNARPTDYRIVQHVIHPDYKPPSLYNDIALFRLEKDVEFSAYVRPICLNSDPLLNPVVQIATGWGRISTAGPTSEDLLKVDLNIIPISICNSSYFSSKNQQLEFGILKESMICAGSIKGGKDTCTGDSGGPLQIKSFDYFGTYTQIGITSFGKFCGDKDAPAIYTKVSKYISWIENIVWSNDV